MAFHLFSSYVFTCKFVIHISFHFFIKPSLGCLECTPGTYSFMKKFEYKCWRNVCWLFITDDCTNCTMYYNYSAFEDQGYILFNHNVLLYAIMYIQILPLGSDICLLKYLYRVFLNSFSRKEWSRFSLNWLKKLLFITFAVIVTEPGVVPDASHQEHGVQHSQGHQQVVETGSHLRMTEIWFHNKNQDLS